MQPKPTALTLFSGGGLSAIGIRDAGFELIGAVEWNGDDRYGPPDVIAQYYIKNIGDHVVCAPVQDVDYRKWHGVDLVQASPPCCNASIANANAGETELDKEMARAIVRCIEETECRCFVLENVSGYRHFESFKIITDRLTELGYWYDSQLLNSEDFGVPQSRRRLILRAVKGQMVPALPAPTRPKLGWFAAIEDLLPSCPESQFAPWQLQRLPEQLISSCLVDTMNTVRDATVIETNDPSYTVKSSHYRRPITIPQAYLARVSGEGSDVLLSELSPAPTLTTAHGSQKYGAYLIDGKNTATETNGRNATIKAVDDPCFTVTAIDRVDRLDAYQQHQSPSQCAFDLFEDGVGSFLTDGFNASRDATVRIAAEPAMTVAANHMRRPASSPKAFIVDGDNAGKVGPDHDGSNLPCHTVSNSSKPRAFIASGQTNDNGTDMTCCDGEVPSFAVTASTSKRPTRAFLHMTGNTQKAMPTGTGENSSPEPANTVTAGSVPSARAWLSQGKVVSLTPRCLARFQTLPDWYVLPEGKGKFGHELACRIIGNGLPCELMRIIAEGLLPCCLRNDNA